MTTTLIRGVLAIAALSFTPHSFAGFIMYGGLGGHSISSGPAASANDGSLAIVDQTTGAVTIVGHPAGVARISGLAFDLTGALYGATQVPGGFPPPPGAMGGSALIRLNPDTGALLSSVPIIAGLGGQNISIADLSVQPDTGALYGIEGPNDGLNLQGDLYTINKTTGVATLLGATNDFFGSIAFAPNGTLYMASADLDFATGMDINVSLKTLDPTNAKILKTVAMNDFMGAFGVRPDGTIFGGTGDQAQLFTINPVTGAETPVGTTGMNFVGDLDFRAVPEPSTAGLIAAGLLIVVSLRRRASGECRRSK